MLGISITNTTIAILFTAIVGLSFLLVYYAQLYVQNEFAAPMKQRRQVNRPTMYVVVTAHPDDESMFFVPTLRTIAKAINGSIGSGSADVADVSLLCLSTGNFDGLGSTRTEEVKACWDHLGFHRDDVNVLDDPELQDGMKANWSCDVATKLIRQHIQRRVDLIARAFDSNACDDTNKCQNDKDSDTVAKDTNHRVDGINCASPQGIFFECVDMTSHKQHQQEQHNQRVVLLTFDANGVSAHPNHIAVHNAARETLRQYTLSQYAANPGDEQQQRVVGAAIERKWDLELWELDTVPLKYKYFGMLTAAVIACQSMIWPSSFTACDEPASCNGYIEIQQHTMKYTKSASFFQVNLVASYRAMQIHASQFVWYRRLFVVFSSYTFVNTWRLVEYTEEPTGVCEHDKNE